MSLASLEEAISDGDSLLLDASALIGYLNGGEAVTPVAAHVVDSFVRGGRNHAVVSAVTVMELLVRPLRQTPPQHHLVLDFLRRFPNLRVVDVTLDVALAAASLRADHALRTPDALTIATGVLASVDQVVTNDRRWDRVLSPVPESPRVCYLASHLPFP